MGDNETTLPRGFFLKPAHDKAPSWVKGQIGIKVDEAIGYLQEHVNDRGYVNLDLKESKGGKLYLDLNVYVAKEQSAPPPPADYAVDDEFDNEEPF